MDTMMLNNISALTNDDKRAKIKKKIEEMDRRNIILLLQYMNDHFKTLNLEREYIIIFNLSDISDEEIDILDDKLNIILQNK